MPDRIIRESALLSATLDQLTGDEERLFWRLVVVADDYGRFDADPSVMLARAFPRKVGILEIADVREWRDRLVKVGLIELYRIGERVYGRFLTWTTHQRKRDSRPKFPGPEDGAARNPPRTAASRRKLPRVAATRGSRARVREPRAESREKRAESRRASGDPRQPPFVDNSGDNSADHPAKDSKCVIRGSIERGEGTPRGQPPALRNGDGPLADLVARQLARLRVQETASA